MPRHLTSVLIPLVVCCAVLGGWSMWGPSNAGGVAVVDLDEIAKRLGRTDQMQQSISSHTDQLNQQLAALQQDATQKLDELKSKVGPNPTQEKSAALSSASYKVTLELTKRKQQAEMLLAQHKQKLAGEFRQAARPYTERVAKARGFETVVTRNDAMVFSFSDSVDITNAVYQAMMAEGHAAVAAPARQQSPDAFPAAPPAPPIQQAGFEQPAGR